MESMAKECQNDKSWTPGTTALPSSFRGKCSVPVRNATSSTCYLCHLPPAVEKRQTRLTEKPNYPSFLPPFLPYLSPFFVSFGEGSTWLFERVSYAQHEKYLPSPGDCRAPVTTLGLVGIDPTSHSFAFPNSGLRTEAMKNHATYIVSASPTSSLPPLPFGRACIRILLLVDCPSHQSAAWVRRRSPTEGCRNGVAPLRRSAGERRRRSGDEQEWWTGCVPAWLGEAAICSVREYTLN